MLQYHIPIIDNLCKSTHMRLLVTQTQRVVKIKTIYTQPDTRSICCSYHKDRWCSRVAQHVEKEVAKINNPPSPSFESLQGPRKSPVNGVWQSVATANDKRYRHYIYYSPSISMVQLDGHPHNPPWKETQSTTR